MYDFEGTAADGVGRRLDSTTITNYNVRDQVTSIRKYSGDASSTQFQDWTNTYDGFGRLQTSHSPEQQPEPNNPASSNHTFYSYNQDDTIDYLNDARGVVMHFAYNNRSQVTGITYDINNLPAGSSVVSTAPATFNYDVAGNRVSMSDGTGTINYTYDDLSRLSSETRQFSGPLAGAAYTLNYQYNLGGGLKQITDHTNAIIRYEIDKVGQTVSVAGEGTLAGTTFASALQYSPWGAPKKIVFGNGTQQEISFNARLLPTTSSLSNVVVGSNQSATMSWSFDYYADGRERHAFDAADDRFDRMLEYDFTGRLKEAYSGREARGLPASSPIPDSPYRQSFQYDAFDNQTQKTGRFWRTVQSGNTPCVPRKSTDGCDAEGNLLTYLNDVHSYDAAAKQVKYLNWRYTVGGSPNHPEVQPSVELVQTYDANGQPAKRVETRRSEELLNGGPNTTISETVTTTYYIYAAMLGGAKVLELDGNGVKTAGYVYANGTRLAKQEGDPTFSGVSWYHFNGGTDSWVETGSERLATRQEMDPDGAEVGTEDPWVAPEEPPNYENLKGSEPLYIEGGDPFDYATGVTIDGLPASKAQIARMLGKAGASRTIISEKYLVDPRMLDLIGDKAFHYAGMIAVELPNVSQSQRAANPATPQNPNEIKINQAFGDASSALAARQRKYRSCLDFFTQGRSLAEVSKILLNFWKTAEPDPSAKAIAGTSNSGQGMAARLTLYAPFFANDGTTEAGMLAGYNWSPTRSRYEELFTSLTPRQYRALTVLHEFAHALGLIPSDKDSKDQSQKNDAKIFEKCGSILDALPAN